MMLVVLLIAFGKNPTLHKKQEVFEQSLEEKLNKKNGLDSSDLFDNSGTTMRQTGGGQNPFAVGGGNNRPGGSPSNPAMQMPGGNQAGGMPGVTLRLPTPASPANNGIPNTQPGLANAPPGTPPPPGTQPGNLLVQPNADLQRQVSAQAAGEPQAPAFYLKDGRRIFFSGFTVFIMGNDGSILPLPDGRYTMQSGDTILIKDGKRTTE